MKHCTGIKNQPSLARGTRRVGIAKVVGREDFRAWTGHKGLLMLIARRQHTVPPFPCKIGLSSGYAGGEDEFVGRRGRRGGVGGCEEVGFVRSIERIREGEPGDERLVTGSFDAYVVGFEYCGYEKMRLVKT